MRVEVPYHFLSDGGMGGSQLTTDTAAKNSVMIDFFRLICFCSKTIKRFAIHPIENPMKPKKQIANRTSSQANSLYMVSPKGGGQ